jgi:ERO1-like protein beta
MYLNTVLLLRAVSRVGPFLSAYNLDSERESKTNALLTDVLSIAKAVGAFDEKALFAGNDAKVRIMRN